MKNKSVLVVDDEADIREAVSAILIDEKYKVDLAINCDDALKKLKKKVPDIILLDIMMPGTPVKDFLKQICPEEKYSRVQILYITAVSLTEAQGNELIGQCDLIKGFIHKPFTSKELLDSIKHHTK